MAEIIIPDPEPKTWLWFDTIRNNCVYERNFVAALEDFTPEEQEALLRGEEIYDSIHQDEDYISLSEDA